MSSYEPVQEKINDTPQPKQTTDNRLMSNEAQQDWQRQIERSRQLAMAREGGLTSLRVTKWQI